MSIGIGRRQLISALCGAAVAWPLASRAQQPKWVRIGWLSIAPHPFIEGFRQGMRDLGWREGDNYEIEQQYADGHAERLIDLATALGQSRNDVIVASGSDAVETAGKAIHSIPVVGVSATMGLSGSLARPEGNVTGIALLYDEIAAKWPELLLQIFSRAKRIGVIYDQSTSNQQQLQAVETTAARLGQKVTRLPIEDSDAVVRTIDHVQTDTTDALIFVSSPIFTANAAQITEHVRRLGLPAIYESRVLVKAGGLISYGPNLNEMFRRVAYYVDRIINGAKPTELPIERPTQFELVVNINTAKQLGLDVPPTLLARADEVIE
jgi:putative tryptophan/tyrosine transport system substrate-binding protein